MKNAPSFECPRCGHCCKREWVGLTDEEISRIDWWGHETLDQYARKIEAKLKEKNE